MTNRSNRHVCGTGASLVGYAMLLLLLVGGACSQSADQTATPSVPECEPTKGVFYDFRRDVCITPDSPASYRPLSLYARASILGKQMPNVSVLYQVTLKRRLRFDEYSTLIADSRVESVDRVGLYFAEVDGGLSSGERIKEQVPKDRALHTAIQELQALLTSAAMNATASAVAAAEKSGDYVVTGVDIHMQAAAAPGWWSAHGDVVESLVDIDPAVQLPDVSK